MFFQKKNVKAQEKQDFDLLIQFQLEIIKQMVPRGRVPNRYACIDTYAYSCF